MAENLTALPRENTEHYQFGRNAEPYLEIGCVVCGKYRVEKMVGGGGFGQVYSVVDERSDTTLAMKIESERHEPARLVLEYKVLSALQGTPHIPYFFACGSFENFNYIVMELLGQNLSELRRQQRKHRLSVATVTRVSKQCCNALKAIHDSGFIHRDVKPSNLCIGLRDRSRVVHLIDFGIARQYRHLSGVVRKERQYAGFRGTMRYVSLTVHERREQGPVDDLWSLFYSIVELIEGTLPWRNLPEPDTIALCKQKTSFNELGRLLPHEMEKLFHYLQTLQYNHFPDYSLIFDILQSSEPPGTTEDEPYDWEKRVKKTKTRRSTNLRSQTVVSGAQQKQCSSLSPIARGKLAMEARFALIFEPRVHNFDMPSFSIISQTDPVKVLHKMANKVSRRLGKVQDKEVEMILSGQKQKRSVGQEPHLYSVKFVIELEEVDQRAHK